jgi:RNA polymerase sigma-70 factor, ECF subfamily
MHENAINQMQKQVDTIYRSESRRVFATLIRLLGNFDLAEEAMHEAFATAVMRWSHEGMPANPRAWLVSVGRFKAIDTLRRRTRFDASLAELAQQPDINDSAAKDSEEVEDDRLRLIFTCCHPALSSEAQIALRGCLRSLNHSAFAP